MTEKSWIVAVGAPAADIGGPTQFPPLRVRGCGRCDRHGSCCERETKLLEQSVEVRSMQSQEIPMLMRFLLGHIRGDWVRHARDTLTHATKGLADYDQSALAVRDSEAVRRKSMLISAFTRRGGLPFCGEH